MKPRSGERMQPTAQAVGQMHTNPAPEGRKRNSFLWSRSARVELAPFLVFSGAGFVVVASEVNSRFLTGPSALFGMTGVYLDGPFSNGEALRHSKANRRVFGRQEK
jgi:hypothetical protein